MKPRITAFLGVLVLTLGLTSTGHAFKSKTHVVIANMVLADAADGRLSIPGLSGLIDPQDSELIAALNAHPQAFRAGMLGPDNYPDIAAGQAIVHVNNGASLADQATPFESRRISQWRSIDYGMYLLQRARAYNVSATERARALAFAYGYLGHMVADGFAHGYVNEWSSGAWSLESGAGVFGPLTEELKHLAVEGLLDRLRTRSGII